MDKKRGRAPRLLPHVASRSLGISTCWHVPGGGRLTSPAIATPRVAVRPTADCPRALLRNYADGPDRRRAYGGAYGSM